MNEGKALGWGHLWSRRPTVRPSYERHHEYRPERPVLQGLHAATVVWDSHRGVLLRRVVAEPALFALPLGIGWGGDALDERGNERDAWPWFEGFQLANVEPGGADHVRQLANVEPGGADHV